MAKKGEKKSSNTTDLYSIDVNDITAYHYNRKKREQLDKYIQKIISDYGSIQQAPEGKRLKIHEMNKFLNNFAAENNLEHVERVLEARREFIKGIVRK